MENICFVDPFPRDSFDFIFTQTHKLQHAFVVSTGQTPLEGVVVGYVMVECGSGSSESGERSDSVGHGNKKAEILSIAVRPDYRGHGAAASLLARALETAREEGCMVCSLHVLVGNVSAQRLYTKKGFACVARAQCYYGTSSGPQKGDALVMECKLGEHKEETKAEKREDIQKNHSERETLLQCPECESLRCTYSTLSPLITCDDCDCQWQQP